MKRPIELLAPGGDIDAAMAAIAAGADAIYCGLDRFNARNRAANISLEELHGLLRLAHKNNCRLFLTLNIIIIESEIASLVKLLNTLKDTDIDGIIVQDIGIFHLLSSHFKQFNLHASTQMTTHNEGQILFLHRLKATRVNISRELNINEIKSLTSFAHDHTIKTEVFVHGSNCVSFSGLCYLSSVLKGKSGNRGRCSQPCRDQYTSHQSENPFPLNLKDNSVYAHIKEIYDAGVDSIKIEGRIKKFHYVYTVVHTWRKLLTYFYKHGRGNADDSSLRLVFNRDFSDSFLVGNLCKQMFIDNPRDNSANYRYKITGGKTLDDMSQAKQGLYDEKTKIIGIVSRKIQQLCTHKAPMVITISGSLGNYLKVSIGTPDELLCFQSKTILKRFDFSKRHKNEKRDDSLRYENLFAFLEPLNNTDYFIDEFHVNKILQDLYIPISELAIIKNNIFKKLNGSQKSSSPVTLPKLPTKNESATVSALSILISDTKDATLTRNTEAAVYFQIPSFLQHNYHDLVTFFSENRNITPWFPSILIGEDYSLAIKLLHQLNPRQIVTNNTGIGYKAYQNSTPWIAGPQLNIANSYALLSLKKKFNCSGAFLSNELSRIQLKSIKQPDDFSLYYSLYHPLLLISSRHCLFQHTKGCQKNVMDKKCLPECINQTTLITKDKSRLYIEKGKCNFNNIYNAENFLNSSIVTDLPNRFTSFFIDLRNIKTDTVVVTDKPGLINAFEDFLKAPGQEKDNLKKALLHTTATQYDKGL